MSKKVINFLIWLGETVLVFVVMFTISTLLLKYVYVNEEVFGTSMEPTLVEGDRLIASRNAKIQRNDIVSLKAPDEPGEFYIKRVIGMPGDTVSSKNDVLYVNGNKVSQSYLASYQKEYVKTSNGQPYTTNFTLSSLPVLKGATKVPANSYFVLGDHRSVSKDSRYIGFIPKSSIQGVVRFRFWPINRFKVF